MLIMPTASGCFGEGVKKIPDHGIQGCCTFNWLSQAWRSHVLQVGVSLCPGSPSPGPLYCSRSASALTATRVEYSTLIRYSSLLDRMAWGGGEGQQGWRWGRGFERDACKALIQHTDQCLDCQALWDMNTAVTLMQPAATVHL